MVDRNRGAVHFDKPAIAAGTDVVDGVGDQLLASASLSENRNSGVRGHHAPNLLEHRFQRGATAHDPLELGVSALAGSLNAVFALAHRLPPQALPVSLRHVRSKQARTRSNRTTRSKGFAKNAAAPALIARIRIFSSPCAVIKITGIAWPSSFNRDCKSRPDMPGIRMSAIRQRHSGKRPEARNSSADENALTGYPDVLSSRSSPVRTISSSSTTAITRSLILKVNPPRAYRIGSRCLVVKSFISRTNIFRRKNGTAKSERR